MSRPMQWAMETWAPEYGSASDDAMAQAESAVDVGLEVPADEWAPCDPGPVGPVDELCFVDGVRRVEGRVWVTDDDGTLRQGIVASYAAGVVRCNGAATVVDARVERVFLCDGGGLSDIETRHGTFTHRPVAVDSPDALSLALQGAMGELEARVALDTGTPGLIVVDGPLSQRRHLSEAVGYVKTHHVGYLPPVVADVVPELGDGQRTPVFCIGDRFARTSWYLRLPGRRAHGWSGVVRCEAGAEVPVERAVELADLTASLLPRFASLAHKDPRAPQNLVPIGGLERELRRRLGDPRLIRRALEQAAA